MAFWIVKTEPGTYSFEDLMRDKTTHWDGVRNYQARNNLKAMQKGDLCMVYHSVGPKELVGIAEVTKTAFVDKTAKDDERWVAVELRAREALKKAVTLEMMKKEPKLQTMALLKQSRLSVCPLSPQEWQTLLLIAAK